LVGKGHDRCLPKEIRVPDKDHCLSDVGLNSTTPRGRRRITEGQLLEFSFQSTAHLFLRVTQSTGGKVRAHLAAYPSASSSASESLTGGKHIRPLHTSAQAVPTPRRGACATVSASASGSPPPTCSCVKRTTTLFTAKRATASASSSSASSPLPTITACTGSSINRSSASP